MVDVRSGSLVGAWRLVSYVGVDENGAVLEEPLGPSPTGLLIYTADGHMSAQLMRTQRVAFAGPTARDGTITEKASVVDDYVGYAGTWQLKGDTVLHRVTVCSFPNWVGGTQIRTPSLQHDQLKLSLRPASSPARRELRWQRV